jgi:hypothetical protein
VIENEERKLHYERIPVHAIREVSLTSDRSTYAEHVTILNEFSDGGWELVAVVPIPGTNRAFLYGKKYQQRPLDPNLTV